MAHDMLKVPNTNCLPHFLEDELALKRLALPFGTPDAQYEGYIGLSIKAALFYHVVLCNVQLQQQ